MIKTRLIGLLSHAKKYIVYQVFFSWVALLCQVRVIFAVTALLEMALKGDYQREEITSCVIWLAAALILRFMADRLGARASFKASVDVKRILREKIYEKLLRLGTSYREKISTAELVQMSGEGVEQLEIYFGKYLSQLFYSLLAPITLFIILKNISFKASLVLLICVPLIPISIVVVQKIAKRLLNKYWGIYTGLGDHFLENLQGLTTLKVFQADAMKAKEMDAESEHFRKITMKVLTMQLNSTSVMDIVAYGGAAVGMVVVISEFLKGNVTFTGSLTIILLASEFFIPLRLLGSFFHIAMNGMAASDKIFAFLDLPEGDQGKEVLKGEVEEILFQNVRFGYETDKEIIKGVSFDCKKNSLSALVGVSGCGKSTVAGLLMGRNKNYEGSILFHTESKMTELSDLDERELMKEVTYVSHNSYLFKGTVKENLLMGKPDATNPELWEVLERVNMKEELIKRGGLNTPVAEKGSNFSGGQCQRMALARALLHDSPIYIFDEATSNIDVESEDMIMEVIRGLTKDHTVLVISHRLANVVHASVIYMMQEGEIIETGSHEELMKNGGAYKRIFEKQQELEKYSYGADKKEVMA